MPHAWKAGEQTAAVAPAARSHGRWRRGGRSRCPPIPRAARPAPYERASLIAHYLKTHKPRSKVIILDAKDGFSKQRLFENAWKELYPGLIERVGLSQGGSRHLGRSGHPHLVTEFGNYKADVANIIPPQKAGRIADIAGVADHTGWCPIDPMTFASTCVPNVHVIGDACLGGAMPKSASAANAQGKACARVIVEPDGGQDARTTASSPACATTRRAGLRVFARRHRIGRRTISSWKSRPRRHSPVEAPPRGAQAGGRGGRGWFTDDHGGNIWLGRRSISLAGAVCLRAVAPPWRGAGRTARRYECAVTPFRLRSPARRAMLRADARSSLERGTTCILCHAGPFPEVSVSRATSRPSLAGTGARWSEASCGCGWSMPPALNPETIMPSYYRDRGLDRVGAGLARQADPVGRADRGHRGVPRDAAGLGRRMMRNDDRARPRAAISSRSPAARPWPAPFSADVRPADARRRQAMAAAIRDVVGEADGAHRQGQARHPAAGRERQHRADDREVESPMTAEDHVKAFTSSTKRTRNPTSSTFISARAPAAPRCRPASGSPTARRSSPSPNCRDGSFWSASVDVIVTLAACTEEVI